jgi:hypothetical protein
LPGGLARARGADEPRGRSLPMRAAFGLGVNEATINTANAQGAALAAIKGLNQKLDDAIRARDVEISTLQQRVAALESLSQRVAAIEANARHALDAMYQPASAVNPYPGDLARKQSFSEEKDQKTFIRCV